MGVGGTERSVRKVLIFGWTPPGDDSAGLTLARLAVPGLEGVGCDLAAAGLRVHGIA